MRILFLAALALGCQVPTVPYVRQHALEPFDTTAIRLGVNPWFVDGPPTRFTAYNPLARPIEAEVYCQGDIYTPFWLVKVKPWGNTSVLGQQMNGVHDACSVCRYRFTDDGKWAWLTLPCGESLSPPR